MVFTPKHPSRPTFKPFTGYLLQALCIRQKERRVRPLRVEEGEEGAEGEVGALPAQLVVVLETGLEAVFTSEDEEGAGGECWVTRVEG